jgi:hypothetical protein
MRISLRAFRQEQNISSAEEWMEFLEECVSDSIVPALCDEGCEVEPDGECEHGCPSVLLACGMI